MASVQRATSLRELVRVLLDRVRFCLLVTDPFSGQVEIRRQGPDLLPPLERILPA